MDLKVEQDWLEYEFSVGTCLLLDDMDVKTLRDLLELDWDVAYRKRLCTKVVMGELLRFESYVARAVLGETGDGVEKRDWRLV